MRILKKASLFAVSVVILLLFAGYSMQKKLIFLPTQLPDDYSYNFDLPFEEFFIDSEDGARLNALHFKVQHPKGVIIYFHGNAGDLSRWGEISSFFTRFDYEVVVMDYRTYGKSTGKISEDALYKDAQLFYDYASKHFSGDNIIIYGRSLGTALATYVASRNKVKKLILETPFYNLTDAAKYRIPYLPVRYLLKYKFPSNLLIQQVSAPVAIFHGMKDSVVPYSSGKKLSKLVPEERLTFVTIPEGDHNDLVNFDVYRKGIETLLK